MKIIRTAAAENAAAPTPPEDRVQQVADGLNRSGEPFSTYKADVDRGLDHSMAVRRMMNGMDRGFHLQTVLGRILQPWTVKYVRRGPFRDEATKGPNDKFRQMYRLFHDAIADAVASVPKRDGTDMRDGGTVDTFDRARELIPGGKAGSRIVDAMRRAWQIGEATFNHDGQAERKDAARDFGNFFQILHEEYSPQQEYLSEANRYYGLAGRENVG